MRVTNCIWLLSLLALPAFHESKIGGWTRCVGKQSQFSLFSDKSRTAATFCSPTEVCRNGDCACPEGTEHHGQHRECMAVASPITVNSGWTRCANMQQSNLPNKKRHEFCSPTEVCSDGECICPEGTEQDSQKRGCVVTLPTVDKKILSDWTPCTLKFPNRYCSPAEVCLSDGECACPEGSENDGHRGCIDVDECAATNYPCPGTRGVESFCVDRDPDNHFYKCGCLPGYRAVYSRDYNQRATGVPLQYRPRECVETFLVKSLQQTFMLSIPSITTTDITKLIEGYKVQYRSIIEGISVRFNSNTRRLNSKDAKVILSAKEKNVIGTVETTDCVNLFYEPICLTFEISSTYLVVVTEERGGRKMVLDHDDVLDRYLSNIDGFSNIVHSFDELEEYIEKITIDSAYSTMSNAFEGINSNSHPGRIAISPINRTPKIDDEVLIVEETHQSKPGGQVCSSGSECVSGICGNLDLKCEDESVPYELFLVLEDKKLTRLEDLIYTYAGGVTEAVSRVVQYFECSADIDKTCRLRLLERVKFEGYYETTSELFDTGPSVDNNAKLDECNVDSRLISNEPNSTNTSTQFNNSTNSETSSTNTTQFNNSTNSTLPDEEFKFKTIMFFQIVFRCRGCAKGALFQNDASRRHLRSLNTQGSVPTELCEADDQEALEPGSERIVSQAVDDKLREELPEEIANVFVGALEFQDFYNPPSTTPSIVPSEPPSERPSFSPSVYPTIVPTTTPSANPTANPSGSPTGTPSVSPTAPPTTLNPTPRPTMSVVPSSDPSILPSLVPSSPPSVSQTPSSKPSNLPSISGAPSNDPSDLPSQLPSSDPSNVPSVSISPSVNPSTVPSTSQAPSKAPSSVPSSSQMPSNDPSILPSLSVYPSIIPSISIAPSYVPSDVPSFTPSTSTIPSSDPSAGPSASFRPTRGPTVSPSISQEPTSAPSNYPSVSISPSSQPSVSINPSSVPTSVPSIFPSTSISPSEEPTRKPSSAPSLSFVPTITASSNPSAHPSITSSPSAAPTSSPSSDPSSVPSLTTVPSFSPTRSHQPSKLPSTSPLPSSSPSKVPSESPTPPTP